MLRVRARRSGVALLAVGCLLTVAAAPATASPGPAVHAAVAPAPIGSFENASARFGSTAPLAPNVWVEVLSGWAADPDAPGQSMWVHFWVDGHPFGAVQTGDPRPDVQGAYPWAGPATGWHQTVSARDLGPGPHVVCAYAIKVAGGANPLLGCKTLPTSGADPNNPIGNLESVTTSPGLVRLSGWAGDPDGAMTTRIRIYYDTGAEPVLDASASLPRPDVKNVFPGFPRLSATTGFTLTLPIPPGGHTVCVYAQNTGRAGLQNSTVGCRAVQVPGAPPLGAHDPRGHLDAVGVTPGQCFGLNSCSWNASGWAYDPDTAGPVQVRIRTFADNVFDVLQYRRSTVTATTGVARPDVQSAFPAAGANAGFDDFIIATNHGSPRLVCAYAINVGPGADRFLGCDADA